MRFSFQREGKPMSTFLKPDSHDNQVPTFTPRLWNPEDQCDDEHDEMGKLTLRQCYEQHYKKLLEKNKRAVNTFKAYENALNHWERLMPRNPTLAELGDDTMDEFLGKVDLGPSTGNKWCRHLRAILNHMGPRVARDRRSRVNKKYFVEVPFLDNVEEQPPKPIRWKDSALNSLYVATSVATWPPKSRTGVEPPHWWKASLVYLVNYGPRRDDWLFVPASNFDFETGEFSFTAKKTGKLHELVLNDAMRAHFEPFPANGRQYQFSPTKAHKQLYEQWHRIQREAGICCRLDVTDPARHKWQLIEHVAPEAWPTDTPIGFHDLRAAAAQRYHRFAPMTPSMLLGHSLPDEKARVTKEFYIGREWLEPLFEAIRTIPQPIAFRPLTEAFVKREKEKELERLRKLKQEDPNQLHLFE